MFLSPRWGFALFPTFAHGLRRGLHSSAALRLDSSVLDLQDIV
jgi:hypothetical protein